MACTFPLSNVLSPPFCPLSTTKECQVLVQISIHSYLGVRTKTDSNASSTAWASSFHSLDPGSNNTSFRREGKEAKKKKRTKEKWKGISLCFIFPSPIVLIPSALLHFFSTLGTFPNLFTSCFLRRLLIYDIPPIDLHGRMNNNLRLETT